MNPPLPPYTFLNADYWVKKNGTENFFADSESTISLLSRTVKQIKICNAVFELLQVEELHVNQYHGTQSSDVRITNFKSLDISKLNSRGGL